MCSCIAAVDDHCVYSQEPDNIIYVMDASIGQACESQVSHFDCLSGMCPGLREWWLHKGVLNLRILVIFNIYAQTVSRIPCRHFVLCKD